MARTEDLARFVPDLARARDAGIELEVGGVLGLFDRDLIADERAWRKLAAVRVHARVQARGVTELRAAIPLRLAQGTGAIPEPRLGQEGRTRIPNGAGAIEACSGCTYRPGYELCHACGGTGRAEIPMPTGTIRETCRACSGRSHVACSRCEGHARLWIGPALEVTDRYGELRHVYAPEVSLALQEAIAAIVEEQPPPAVLSVPLEPRAVDPYRGTLAGHAIAAHAYDAVMPTVRAAIGGLAGELEVVASEVSLHAWPFLFARASRVEAALVVDHGGALRCLRALAD